MDDRERRRILSLLDSRESLPLPAAARLIADHTGEHARRARATMLQLVNEGELFLHGPADDPDACRVETIHHRRLRHVCEMHEFHRRIHAA